ncbi:MAG: hypothetical protein HY707_03385 [Ignavibacteriae bacterium]|nr:hypothetical protein [Ignavibacteriota bacterium]
MKIIVIILRIVFLSSILSWTSLAQESPLSDWQFMPSLAVVDYFPSARIELNETYRSSTVDYSGFGFMFHLRSFNRHFDPFVFTLGAGVIWFEGSRPYRIVIPFGVRQDSVDYLRTNGIGEILKSQEFTSFPITLGIETVFPETEFHDIMFFVGGNIGAHFIDGDIDIGQQVKFGYSFGGGFTVKMFEFGVRYNSFSDIKNIGAHVGLRFNSFMLK